MIVEAEKKIYLTVVTITSEDRSGTFLGLIFREIVKESRPRCSELAPNHCAFYPRETRCGIARYRHDQRTAQEEPVDAYPDRVRCRKENDDLVGGFENHWPGLIIAVTTPRAPINLNFYGANTFH